MKLDKEAIKDLAIRNLQYDTGNPFEATLRAVETWLEKNEYVIVEKMDYFRIQARDHQELSRGYKINPQAAGEANCDKGTESDDSN